MISPYLTTDEVEILSLERIIRKHECKEVCRCADIIERLAVLKGITFKK